MEYGYVQYKYARGDEDMNLKINTQQQSDKEIVVTVAGEIDAYTAPKLREELFPFAEGDLG